MTPNPSKNTRPDTTDGRSGCVVANPGVNSGQAREVTDNATFRAMRWRCGLVGRRDRSLPIRLAVTGFRAGGCTFTSDEGLATIRRDGQTFFGSWNLKVFTNSPELRFCCAGEIETFRFALVSDQETTETLLFVNVQEVEDMRTPSFFGQITCPCTFINSVSSEIKDDGCSRPKAVDDERAHD